MIRVNLDVMLAKRRLSSGELAERLGITPANLSILKTNKEKPSAFLRSMRSAGFWNASRRTFWNTFRTQRKARPSDGTKIL